MKSSSFLDDIRLHDSLRLLNEQLILSSSPSVELVICGGSALIASKLVLRTTCDVDILALMKSHQLIDAEPLPDFLLKAAGTVADILHLPEDWLNNGPASQFSLGLPDGLQKRLLTEVIGEKLTVHYIGRYDQILFKTFASADRGGYHVSDLRALKPSEEELVLAAEWCMTQDVSEEFHMILKDMFQQLGWKNVSERI